MADRGPSWADLNVAPASKASRKKIAGIGCASVAGVTVVLAIIGAIVGPPKASPTAQHTVAAAPVTTTPASTPPTTAAPSHSITARPTPTRTPAPKKPAPAAPLTALTFSGGFSGSTKQALDILPTQTGADYSYISPEGSTQCVMPASDGAWSAQVTFDVGGIAWEMQIGAPGFGLPSAGSHPGLPQNLTGGNGDDPNAVSLWVGSDKGPAGSVGQGSGIGRFGYTYYTPEDHNNGAGTVVINKNLTSGTVDVWLTPIAYSSLEFHLTGSWSCA